MNVSRRNFVGGAFALCAAGGCRSPFGLGRPDLRLGVVSDIHVMTPETTGMFCRSLAYFRSRGVDAVVVPGDLGDWGLVSNFVDVKKAWDDVMSGSGIVPLFCTGNHDYDGFAYGDMTVEMHALGYSERDAIVRTGMKAVWEKVFGEPFADVRCRTVKGYDFISLEYRPEDPEAFAKWMAKNGAKYADGRPFFFFQHCPLRDTPKTKALLDPYPNCIAFTGHVHVPFNDERDIRQEPTTEISVPSLSYAGIPGGHENGSAKRDGTCAYAMQMIPDRFNLRGGQGYVVDVFGGEMVVERRDLEEGCVGAADWIVPLDGSRPYALDRRAERIGVPAFPSGAAVALDTRNATNRQGKWIAALRLEFPSARVADGTRVWDYEVRAVPKNGGKPMVKAFLSPAYSRLERYEPARQCFWFDVADLPQDCPYAIEVRARNCFGRASAPLVTRELRGQPGLDKCVNWK